jgi:MFS family permease
MVVAIAALPRVQSLARRADRRLPFEQLGASLPLAAAFVCFALLFLALAGLLPAYLVDQRGLGADAAARLVAVATALGIIGSLAAAWLLRRGVAPGRLIAIGLVASTAIAALSFGSVSAPLDIGGFALSFAVGGLVPAATFASVPMVTTDARAIGPINGLLAQAGSLGSLAGPPLLALWVEWLGWPTAPVMLIVIAAIGAATALRVKRI